MKLLREIIIIIVIVIALYLIFYAFDRLNYYQAVNCNDLTFNYSGQTSGFELNMSNASTLSVVYVSNTAKVPENISLYAGTTDKSGIKVEYPAPYVVSPGKEAYFQYLVTPIKPGSYDLNLNISARYGNCIKYIRIPIVVNVSG
ncbi:MAG: hypothetical protein QW292_00480 [Candidatus Parvarchaeota archaeon]